jgi:hypothetical protein
MATFASSSILQMADAGCLEVFSGSPDITASNWDSSDLEGYRLVTATIAADRGGVVYAFIVPEKVSSLVSVSVTGKLSNASSTAINIRVKDNAGTQVGSTSITAATKTTATITSFSPTPDLTEGNRIFVEVEGQIGLTTQTASIGSCLIKFARYA